MTGCGGRRVQQEKGTICSISLYAFKAALGHSPPLKGNMNNSLPVVNLDASGDRFFFLGWLKTPGSGIYIYKATLRQLFSTIPKQTGENIYALKANSGFSFCLLTTFNI